MEYGEGVGRRDDPGHRIRQHDGDPFYLAVAARHNDPKPPELAFCDEHRAGNVVRHALSRVCRLLALVVFDRSWPGHSGEVI